MDSKFYVSLEAAKLLKEKGYDKECDYVIDDDGDILLDEYHMNQDLLEWQWSCPTKAEAIDWLESKEIVVQTLPSTPNIWRWRMSSMKYIPYDDNTEDSEMLYKTRLEAEDDAIIIACKLLENGN